MHYICRAPGCSDRAASRFGIYCSSHKAQLRRHGAIGQRAITKADLKLYRALVAARLEKNQGTVLRSQLEAQWKGLVSRAEGIIQAFKAGTPMVRFRREAAREILKLNKGVTIADLIETVLAIYVMQD